MNLIAIVSQGDGIGQATWAVAKSVAPVFLILLIGGVFGWKRMWSENLETGLTHVSIRILFPALIFDRLLGNPTLSDLGQTFLAASIGFILFCLSLCITYAVGPWIGLQQGQGRRTFTLTTSLQNYGFIAIPVCVEVFQSPGAVGMIFLHNVGLEIAMWTAGVGVLTGLRWDLFKRVFSPPVLSIFVVLILNHSGGDQWVPTTFRQSCAMLGACALPMSLLISGSSMGRLLGLERFSLRICFAGIFLRLGVLTALFFIAAWILPTTPDLKKALLVQGVMPAAFFPVLLARLYGGQPHVATQVALATLVASVITLPLALAWGIRWLGL